ncbi:MAG: ABC transporter permease [Treponema sp.]|nr:ABC transporter permease [Treponema sp.]
MNSQNPRSLIPLLPMYLFTLLFILGPLIYLIILSFMQRQGIWGAGYSFSLRNYRIMFEPVYMETFRQSIRLACISTFAVAAAGYPFGYFMARLSQTWRNRVMLLLIIPFWTSALMRLYGWIIVFRANGVFDRLLMGLRITDEPLRLLYTYPAVVTGMIYALLPFMIYSVYASAEKMDRSLIDAARVLGAGRFRAFLTVTFPLTMPGLLSGVFLTFIPSMGLYFIADILGGNKVILTGNLIRDQVMNVHDLPFAAALSVVLILITSLFLLLYRLVTRSGEIEGLI